MIETECHLWGKDFDPSCIQNVAGAVVRDCDTPGEIGITGRYKGKPVPYGACILATPEHIRVPDRILWMADFIHKHIQTFREAGATDIIYWIYWTGTQGNMEFSVEELKKIAALSIPLAIDCIHVQEEDDTWIGRHR